MVLMKRCARPSSPSAWRADLTRLETAASETTRPSDLLHELVLRDQALPVLDEQREQREDLGLDGASLASLAQLEAVGIELEGTEAIEHRSENRSRRTPPP